MALPGEANEVAKGANASLEKLSVVQTSKIARWTIEPSIDAKKHTDYVDAVN